MCIRILCSTLGKREVKTSLDETDSWVWEGSEMTCGIYGEMDSKMFDEMDSKMFDETNKK
jgi:hypothetical protein